MNQLKLLKETNKKMEIVLDLLLDKAEKSVEYAKEYAPTGLTEFGLQENLTLLQILDDYLRASIADIEIMEKEK